MYNYQKGEKVGIKEFFEKSGAKFSEILSKIVPSFAQLSPYLVFATTVIASGGTPEALNIPLVSFIEKVLEKISIDYPVSQILDKITGKDSSKLSKEEIEELKNAIESLCEKFEEASKQNIGFDEQISQFTGALINSEEFKNLEQSIEGLNSKIDVLRGELSESLKYIQEELNIMNTPIIPKIKRVLEESSKEPPEFFHTVGPIWVDFQEGYVYEHPEVSNIINEIKEKDVVVIKGKPASGKSVILKNIGYKLANKGADVYFIGLKTFSEWKTSEISKIRHGFIIVDDAHLEVNFVEDLLLNKPKAKVIIASRDIDLEKVFGPTSEYKFAEYLKNAIKIEARNTADKIIKKFEEKKGTLPNEIKNELAKNNLWILAWQLKSYEKFKKIDEEYVLKTVKAYIEGIRNVKKPENVLAPIAVFYQFEIPVRKTFIESFAEGETIRGLEALNEISTFLSDRRDYVALHHSEVAEVYLKTFGYFKDFGREVKNKINEKYEEIFDKEESNNPNLSLKLFNIYLREYPEETTNVLNYKTRFPYLFPSFSEFYNKNFNDIIKGLEEEEKIQKIETCILYITYANIEVARKIVKRLDINTLVKKIDKEEEVGGIGRCISGIAKVDRDVARKIVARLDINTLVKKIDKEEEVGEIGRCISGIAKADRDVAKEIVDKLDLEDLVKKIDKEEEVGGIGWCLSGIAEADRDVAKEIVDKLDLEDLVKKIDKEEEVGGIGWCISGIAKVDRDVAKEIVDKLDLEDLVKKIDKEEEVGGIGSCISGIAKVDRDVAGKIVAGLDINTLIEKIDKEEKVGEIGSYISGIAKVDRDVAEKIVAGLDINTLIEKIEKEEKGGGIGSCISGIVKADRDVAKEIVDKLDLEDLIEKIEKEEKVGGIGWCISGIAKADRDVAGKIVTGLDINTLIEKIDKEEKVREIGWCISGIAEANEEIAGKILEKLDIEKLIEKINKEEDILKIRWCIGGIAKANKEITNKILERTDIDSLIEKLKKEEDISKIAKLIQGIKKVNETVSSKLLNTMESEKREKVLKHL
jgi:hypothetical protein